MEQDNEQESNNDNNTSNKEEELRSSPKDQELQRGDSRMSIENELVSIYLFN